MFADAAHPTQAARAVGCWAPKDTPAAVTQSSGRDRLEIHDAFDLEIGYTRMFIMLLMAIEVMSPGKRLIHAFFGQRPAPSREAGTAMAGAVGLPQPTALHPVV